MCCLHEGARISLVGNGITTNKSSFCGYIWLIVCDWLRKEKYKNNIISVYGVVGSLFTSLSAFCCNKTPLRRLTTTNNTEPGSFYTHLAVVCRHDLVASHNNVILCQLRFLLDDLLEKNLREHGTTLEFLLYNVTILTCGDG